MVTEIILGVALIVIAVLLVVAVLCQSSKERGLSGAISGGNGSESFFSKSGVATRDKILSRATIVLSVIFVVLVVAMYIYANRIY